MGSCSSVHRDSVCSKTVDKLVILPSPIKDNKPKNDNFIIHDHVAVKPRLSPSPSTNTFNGRALLGLSLLSLLLILMHHHHHIKILFLLIYFSWELSLCTFMNVSGGFQLTTDLIFCGVSWFVYLLLVFMFQIF